MPRKKGLKVALMLLLIILIGLAGFYLYATLVEGRSVQSKAVEVALGFMDYDHWADEEKFAAFMELKQTENLEPYVLPEKTKEKYAINHDKFEGMDCYILTGGSDPGRRQIIYLHGGAYINQPLSFHWSFLDRLAGKTDVTITVPIYPKAPHFSYEDSFAKVLPLYEKLLEENSPEAITLMGDSAGGGFALALAQVLLEKGLPQPGNIILISPWLDITMTNPEIPVFEEKDLMLSAYGLAEVGKVYAGDTDPGYYQLSPINGPVIGLAPITLFIGTHDLLLPDARLFRDLAAAQGVAINYFEYPMMIHCFVVMPMPEAEDALEKIVELI